jgi:hypothetical protein
VRLKRGLHGHLKLQRKKIGPGSGTRKHGHSLRLWPEPYRNKIINSVDGIYEVARIGMAHVAPNLGRAIPRRLCTFASQIEIAARDRSVLTPLAGQVSTSLAGGR